MSTKKLLREVRRELREMGLNTEVETDSSGHPKLLITHRDGRLQRVTVPSSPHDITQARMYLIKYVRTFANQKETNHAEESPH